MNNPDAQYQSNGKGPGLDPALDPNYDWWPWILAIDYHVDDHIDDHLREAAIRRFLEVAGFVDIHVTLVPERGPDSWQIIMRRGIDQERPTVAGIEAAMHAMAIDLDCSLRGDRPCVLVWGDNIGVGLRLQRVDRNAAMVQ